MTNYQDHLTTHSSSHHEWVQRIIDLSAIEASVQDGDSQLMQDLLMTLPDSALSSLPDDIAIARFVNGCQLACPMPLLKTKVALRDLPTNKALYVVATDPHSQADIAAFCHHSGWTLVLNDSTKPNNPDKTSHSLEKLDTIFHFIITKTDSN